MRVIIPPTGNETIGMLKTTSLVLAVPFTLDLTFVTNALASRTFLPIPLLMVAAFWYLVITSVFMVGQFYIERHFGKGVDNVMKAPVKATAAVAAAHANPPVNTDKTTEGGTS
jgi:polar amino acid transport system permease protein